MNLEEHSALSYLTQAIRRAPCQAKNIIKTVDVPNASLAFEFAVARLLKVADDKKALLAEVLELRQELG